MSSINIQKNSHIIIYNNLQRYVNKNVSQTDPKTYLRTKEWPNKHTSRFKWGNVYQPEQNTMERKQMPFPINKISSRSLPNSICWSVMLVFSSFMGIQVSTR